MKRLLKKAMRDLLCDKRRAVMSLLAILIGAMSFGIVTFSYHIISRELVDVYDATNPVSASIVVDRIDENLIALTEDFEGITAFEEKAFYELRIQTGEDEWKTLELFAAADFNEIELNKISSEEGSFQPGENEVLIERDALGVANTDLGEAITVSLSDGSTMDFTVAGIVADIGQHPASMHNWVYLYVSYDTLQSMGLTANKIDFMTSGDPYDRESIVTISNEYMKLLEQNGYTVSNLEISDTPGVSMHLEEYESALFLLQIFSFVTFLFGCMIMSNLISSIISGQTRQIGILKAVGADTGKIAVSYLLAFFILIILTVAISLPLSILLSGALSSALMRLGNMLPDHTSIPGYLYGIYCGLALIVPVVVAFFPIRRGIRISVKDALNDYGVSAEKDAVKLPEPKFLSRPVLLSLRNAVQRKKRFLLNVITLSLAGALFVSVVTSMISIQTTLSNNLDTLKFDYHLTSRDIYDEGSLAQIMENVPNVTGWESWGSSGGKLVYENGEVGNSYSIISPPNGSTMIEPEVIEGRWISEDDTNEIVVTHEFYLSEPGYKLGDTITLRIGNNVQEFVIVGTIKDLTSTAIYISENGFEQSVAMENRNGNVKLSLQLSGKRSTLYKAVESALKEQGVIILQSQSKTDIQDILSGHYTVTLQTFLFITFMLVVVSGFGLAATMNLQTSERTKEIGIMKAMGAAKKQIAKIVTSESIFISLTSWGISILIGIPLGILGVYVFGNIIIETTLDLSISAFVAAYVLWLALTFAVGYFASRACAKRAANMSIRNSLVFE